MKEAQCMEGETDVHGKPSPSHSNIHFHDCQLCHENLPSTNSHVKLVGIGKQKILLGRIGWSEETSYCGLA